MKFNFSKLALSQSNSTFTESFAILFVDDSKSNLLNIEKSLSHLEFLLIRVSSYEEVAPYLSEPKLRAILLNLGMENNNGLEIARQIRKQSVAEPVPIICLVTDETPTAAIEAVSSLKFIDFVYAPLLSKVISAKLDLLSNLKRTPLTESSPIPYATDDSSPSPSPASLQSPFQSFSHAAGEYRFRLLLETLPLIVWTSKADGTIDFFNKRWIDYTGFCLLPNTSQTWLAYVYEEDRILIEKVWRECLQSGKPFEAEIRIRSASDNKYRWNLVRAEALRAENGEIDYWFCFGTDIEDRMQIEGLLKSANKTLAEARDQALEASFSKSLFLANMSHELRTPLNAIIGFAEIVCEDLPSNLEVSRKDIKSILVAAKHLLRLINDILDMAKIEAGKMTVRKTHFDPKDIFYDIIESTRGFATRKNNVILCDLESLNNLTIYSDELKIRQILLNLLSNSCKFTENGIITVQAGTENVQGNLRFVFAVTDNGIGIAEQDLPLLFKEFMQTDLSNSRKFTGTGLGLALSQKLANLLAGNITVVSSLNQGSTFKVSIPL